MITGQPTVHLYDDREAETRPLGNQKEIER